MSIRHFFMPFALTLPVSCGGGVSEDYSSGDPDTVGKEIEEGKTGKHGFSPTWTIPSIIAMIRRLVPRPVPSFCRGCSGTLKGGRSWRQANL